MNYFMSLSWMLAIISDGYYRWWFAIFNHWKWLGKKNLFLVNYMLQVPFSVQKYASMVVVHDRLMNAFAISQRMWISWSIISVRSITIILMLIVKPSTILQSKKKKRMLKTIWYPSNFREWNEHFVKNQNDPKRWWISFGRIVMTPLMNVHVVCSRAQQK